MDLDLTQAHALLVGVGDYTESTLRAPVTANDAIAVGNALIASGYLKENVRVLTNQAATRQRVIAALREFASATGDAPPLMVLFFCGHGYTPPKGGDYQFLTADARWETNTTFNPLTVISAVELVREINMIHANRMVILLNTCFSRIMSGELNGIPGAAQEASAAGELAGSTAPPQEFLEMALGQKGGRVAISASRPHQKSAYRDTDLNTLFGKRLLTGLRGEGVPNRDGYVEVYDLYRYLYRTVHAEISDLRGSVDRDPNGELRTELDQEPMLTISDGVGPFLIAGYLGSAPTAKDMGIEPPALPLDLPQGLVIQVPSVQAGGDVNTTRSGEMVNRDGIGNVPAGSGSQSDFGSIATGRDVYLKSTVNQSQYGGVRFHGPATVHGPVIGGDVTNLIYAGTDVQIPLNPLVWIFAAARQQLQTLSPADQEAAQLTFNQVQEQAEKLQQGDPSADARSLEDRLRNLSGLAPGVARVMIARLQDTSGVADTIRAVARCVSSAG